MPFLLQLWLSERVGRTDVGFSTFSCSELGFAARPSVFMDCVHPGHSGYNTVRPSFNVTHMPVYAMDLVTELPAHLYYDVCECMSAHNIRIVCVCM